VRALLTQTSHLVEAGNRALAETYPEQRVGLAQDIVWSTASALGCTKQPTP